MPKRTTLVLDDDIYEELVKQSLKRYGTARALSKVINDLLRKALWSDEDLVKLIYSRKTKKISREEFERFRKELDKRFIER